MQESSRLPPQVATPGLTVPGFNPAPCGSNAERQGQLGMGGAPQKSAESLLESLPALGPMAKLVLDVLSLSQALDLALEHRTLPWVREWMAEQDPVELLDQGGRVLEWVLDHVWPVGVGLTAKLGEHLSMGPATFGLEATAAVERVAGGFLTSVRGQATLGGATGIGGGLIGARGEMVLGAEVEEGAEALAEVEAEWVVQTPLDLLRTLASGGSKQLADMTFGDPAAARDRMLKAAIDRVRDLPPDNMRIGASGGTYASATGSGFGVGPVMANAEKSCTAGGAVGIADGVDFIEVDLTTRTRAGLSGMVLSTLGRAGVPVLDDLSGEWADRVTLRVSGNLPSLETGQPTGLSIALTWHAESGEVTDQMLTTSVATAARWLIARAAPGAGALMKSEGLPEVSLRRSIERTVSDPASLDRYMPTWMEVLECLLPDRGMIISVAGLKLTGEILVTPAHAAAALDGQPLTWGMEGPEEAMLNVERALAAAMIGGSAPAAGIDIAKGLVGLAPAKAQLTASLTYAIGAGVSERLGAEELGGDASLEATLFIRSDAPAQLGAAERLALFTA